MVGQASLGLLRVPSSGATVGFVRCGNAPPVVGEVAAFVRAHATHSAAVPASASAASTESARARALDLRRVEDLPA